MEVIAKHINEQDGEIKKTFTASSKLRAINEHSMQLNKAAIYECQTEYEIFIDAVFKLSERSHSASDYYSSSEFGASKN